MTERFISDGHPLSPYEREILTIMQEEAAEVIQAASKLLRFGAGNADPEDGVINNVKLAMEIGDLRHMIRRVNDAGLIDSRDVDTGDERKSRRLEKFLQSTEPGK